MLSDKKFWEVGLRRGVLGWIAFWHLGWSLTLDLDTQLLYMYE